MCLARGSTLMISTTPGFGSGVNKWKLVVISSFSRRYKKLLGTGTGTG